MYFSEHSQCLLTILLEKEWELPSKCRFSGLSFFTRGKNCDEAARQRGWHGGQTRLCNLSRLLVTWFLLPAVKTGCSLPLPCKIPWPKLSFCCCCLHMSLCFWWEHRRMQAFVTFSSGVCVCDWEGCVYVTGRRVLNVLSADVIKIPYRANCWRVSCSFRIEQPDWVFRQCTLGQGCWQAAR